jgi:hypothetical protein
MAEGALPYHIVATTGAPTKPNKAVSEEDDTLG